MATFKEEFLCDYIALHREAHPDREAIVVLGIEKVTISLKKEVTLEKIQGLTFDTKRAMLYHIGQAEYERWLGIKFDGGWK